jgi:undecaprenyl diphosphate synthase
MNPHITVPSHIAIIMDGNGRWAKARSFSRMAGHKAGIDRAQEIVKECSRLGVKYLTLYAFSMENWQRPAEEVSNLMTLMRYYLKNEATSLHKNDIKVKIIGDIKKLDKDLQQSIHNLMELTKNNKTMELIIALSYSSREEIIEAAKKIAQDYKDEKVAIDDITPEIFSNYLYTKNIPDPDLLIRTSGELRISNFLIWQMAYTEFYFTKTSWPDFTKEDLNIAIEEFNKRERRYGQ